MAEAIPGSNRARLHRYRWQKSRREIFRRGSLRCQKEIEAEGVGGPLYPAAGTRTIRICSGSRQAKEEQNREAIRTRFFNAGTHRREAQEILLRALNFSFGRWHQVYARFSRLLGKRSDTDLGNQGAIHL